jgi:hypothetical protein
VSDARIYNVWNLSLSRNGWHLVKIKMDMYFKDIGSKKEVHK